MFFCVCILNFIEFSNFYQEQKNKGLMIRGTNEEKHKTFPPIVLAQTLQDMAYEEQTTKQPNKNNV